MSDDPLAPSRRIINVTQERTIAFAQTGTGTDCLLIHGTLMTLEDMWFGLAPTLCREFRVTAVDRPGHGHSQRQPLVDASPWRQAVLIRAAAHRAGLQRPIIVGHSYGGTVALAYAALFPDEIAGVVALAPMCFPEARIESVLFGPRAVPYLGKLFAAAFACGSDTWTLPLLWKAIFLPQFMPQTVAQHVPFDLASQPEQMIAEGEDALALPSALALMAASYARCRIPVHILGGGCDAVVNNAIQGQAAAALLPFGRFDWVPDCGHMLHHFAQDSVRDSCNAFDY